MITAAGVGSGIDVESIISGLMEVEREPVRALEQKRERLGAELSAFGRARSAMSELATSARELGDATRFGPFVASSSDETVMSASASGAAAAETHEIEVLALASAHRIASDPFDDDQAAVRQGSWSFSSGDEAFDVEIDGTNATLRGLRDAINDAEDNDSIVASILVVDDGARLVLSARGSGAANAIEVDAPGGGGGLLGGLGNGNGNGNGIAFTELAAASDASLRVDGLDVTSASNSVAGVIEGVTLELAGVGEATLDTRRDTEALRASLDAFVERYNALRTELSDLAADELQGDRLPRDAESRLRTAFSSELDLAGGERASPLELGFTFDRNGVLAIDESRLAAAQETGLEDFVDAFSRRETGFGIRVSDLLDEFTRADGLIDNRTDGVESRRSRIDDQIERQEYRLERVELRYRRQFETMDRLVSELNSTGQLITQRLLSSTL